MIDNESGEDYLEAILRLSEGGKDVHSVDVAREMAVSKPAVTKAMRILKQKGYVDIVDNHIHFTEEGETYARSVYAKHRTITQFCRGWAWVRRTPKRTPAAWSISSAAKRMPPSANFSKRNSRPQIGGGSGGFGVFPFPPFFRKQTRIASVFAGCGAALFRIAEKCSCPQKIYSTIFDRIRALYKPRGS